MHSYSLFTGGAYNGMMGQLVRDEVFLGAASFTISQDRQKVVKFSTPIDLQPYTFMFQRPQELSR